jgi:hypothetical protein
MMKLGQGSFDYINSWAGKVGEPPRVVHFAKTERDFNIAIRQRVEELDGE